MSERPALAGRIRASIDDVNVSIERAIRLAEKGRRNNDDDYWDGVALNLHGFYSGVEQIFEDIARTIDGALPEGGDWHISLLKQMTVEIGDLRPAVISMKTRQYLDEYRGLRHVIRNVYAFNLRPARLSELVDNAPKCLEHLTAELLAFAEFLDKTS
ncbi:MAG: hypothetical protein RIR73_2800 [Chloroflexota bacterium]|jgi:hypothetical protein